MNNEEKVKAYDNIRKLVKSYFDRLVEQGHFDPDDMDTDEFFQDVMTLVLGEEQWEQISDLPYVD